MKNRICYYCGAPAVSREHVPAKCFFPTDKRDNLITVPSCEEHNENTSVDDSYVLLIITCFINNNQVGKDYSIPKWVDTLKRSPALKNVFASSCRPIDVNKDGEKVHTYKLKIDRKRFDKEVIKMAYALYFHTYEKRWSKQQNIGSPAFICNDGGKDDKGHLIQRVNLKTEACGLNNICPFLGNNQDIFKYRFLKSNDTEEPILQMIFYEGFEVWAFPQNNSNC